MRTGATVAQLLYEREVHAFVVDVVSLWEDLHTELTVDDTVCGQLREECAVVCVHSSVRSVRSNVPSASGKVVDHDVITGAEFCRPAARKGGWVQGRTLSRRIQVQCHVRIVLQGWEERQQQAPLPRERLRPRAVNSKAFAL